MRKSLCSQCAPGTTIKWMTGFLVLFLLLQVTVLSQDRQISLSSVKEIADRNANELWGQVYPAEAIPYYGPGDEIIAYHFNYSLHAEFPEEDALMTACHNAFLDGNRDLGWGKGSYANMVVGAQPYMPVIIEYSNCLSKQYAMGRKIAKAAEKIFGQEYAIGKTYYLGMVNVWFCVMKDDEKKYINIEPSVQVMDEEEFMKFMESKSYFWERDDFAEDWNKSLKNKSPLESGNVYIPGHEQMPFLEWSYGCTPCSGAMLLAWWDNYHHFGNLIDYYMTRWDAVQENYDHHTPWTMGDLADAMETNSSGGTERWNICDGYIEVVEDRGYECSSDGHWAFYWTTGELFDDVKGQINNQRPLHISIEGHSIIGIGYSNTNKTIETHDPNLPAIRTITKSMLEGTYWVNVFDDYGTYVDLLAPHGGTNWGAMGGNQEVVNSNDFMEISWNSDFNPGTYVKLYYHDEGGLTLDRWFPITENTPNDGMYHWHIPDIDCFYGNETDYARVKIEIYNGDDLLIASDGSYGNFDIGDNGGLPELTGLESAPDNPDFFSIPLAEEWWTVCGVRDAGYSAFWEMELYDDIEFQTVVEECYTWNTVNYIVLNGHNAPLQEYGVKVKNYTGASAAYAEYEMSEDYLLPDNSYDFYWGSGSIVRSWDVHLEPGTYYFELEPTSGLVDLDIAIFKQGGDNLFSMQDHVAGSFNIGGGVAESFTFSPFAEGDYGFVVSSNSLVAGNYSIIISDAVRWVGTTSNNWHYAPNWSSGTVPGFEENVIIPAGCPYDPSVFVNDVFINNLTIESGASLEIYDEYMAVYGDLTIYGELIMATGTAELMAENSITWESGSTATIENDGAIINVYRSWYFKEGANVALSQGTVKFVSSYPSFIRSNDEYSYFHDVLIDKSGVFQYHLLSTYDLYIMGDLDINSGSTFTSSSEKSIVIKGNLASAGNIQLDAGTLKFIGPGKFIDMNTGDYFHNLDISTDNACVLYSDLQLSGDMILHNGGLLTLADLYVKGDWKNYGTPDLFVENDNKVVFNGNGQSRIYGEEFYTFEMNSNGEVIFQSGITTIEHYDWVKGALWMKDGTVTINDLVENLGLFGTIILDGGTLNIYQNDYQFVDLNCELYMNAGVMNIYGGAGDSYWGISDDCEIVIEDGILDFKDVGIRLYDSPTYVLGGEINGGIVRTAGNIHCENHNIDMAGGIFEMYGPAAATVQCAAVPLFSLDVNKNAAEGTTAKLPGDPRDVAPVINGAKANNVELPANLTLDGDLIVTSGTLNCMSHTLTIKGDLYIEVDGLLDPDDGFINIYGDWTNNRGSSGFMEGYGLVNFLGDPSSYILTNETFYDLEINKSGSAYEYVWVEPGKTVTVANDLLIGNGAFRLGDLSTLNVWHDLLIGENTNLFASTEAESFINVGNNWFNYNTTGYPWAYGFYYGLSTVTFNGTDDQFIEANFGTQDFYNLKVNKANNWFMPTVHLNVYGDAEIIEGNWNDDVTGKIFSFYGDLIIQPDGTWEDYSNSVHFKGPDDQFLINYGLNNAYFQYLYVIKEEAADIPPVVTLNGDLACYFLWIQEGEMDLNGQALSIDYRIQIPEGGILNAPGISRIKMADGAAILVGGGTLSLLGDGVNNPKVTHKTSGYYTFSIYAGGVLAADHATFEYMNASGVNIFNNGLVDAVNSLNNCTFQEGVSGGTLLRFATTQSVNVANANFPANTWGGASNVTKSATSGTINMAYATGAFSGEAFENDPNDLVDWVEPDFNLEVRVFLEGPYENGLMKFDLGADMPLTQPFNTEPWNYEGTEWVSAPPGKAVDWVLVELRDAPTASQATPETVIARRAAFVKNSGYILDLDGTGFLQFSHVINEKLYVVIWHRNHLGVLSAYYLWKTGDLYTYDFTFSLDQAQGDADAHKEIAPGVYGMVAGDANSDGIIGPADKSLWDAKAGTRGYLPGDFNLDAEVDNKDKNNLLYLNYGWGSQVPD